jgi:hypothetical protein
MALPEPLFYTLADVAKRWKKTESQVLQWGASGALRLAFYCEQDVKISILNTYLRDFEDRSIFDIDTWIKNTFLHATREKIQNILLGGDPITDLGFAATASDINHLIDLLKFHTNDNSFVDKVHTEGILLSIDDDGHLLQLSTETLFVLPDELNKIETDHPELIGKKTTAGSRAEKTDLHIIGALVDILTNKAIASHLQLFKGEDRSIFKNESQLKDFLADKYGDYAGCKTRTLSERFKLARELIQGE